MELYKTAETWQLFLNIFSIDDAGVEGIDLENACSFKVFDLQGKSVMNTPDAEDLKKLENGLYIINGKKVMIEK